jgi:uncharacterized protein YecT (DUF1311 family)
MLSEAVGVLRSCFLTLCISACALAQSQSQTTRPKKVLTPGQIAFQQNLKTYRAEMDRLRASANAALAAESTRENAPECPNANTTFDTNVCLSHEVNLTEDNFKAFAADIRAMLAATAPRFPGQPEIPDIGPTSPSATSATNTAAFDKSEASWQAYAADECSAVDTFWRGGTIVNSMVGECNLRVTRARMHELAAAYSDLLHTL